MLNIQEEKKLIYDLLQNLIDERRELNRQYDRLEKRLEALNGVEQSFLSTSTTNGKLNSVFEKEKIREQDYLFNKNRTQH
ncbi:hypothetical protein K0I06_001909, partial [Enterococcus faecalis]|nr:hypothetical protein [Enterococcus faecalis]